MTAMSDECVFCKMVTREIPADIVAETDDALGFRDINPQAPSHVLVIPKTHLVDVADMALNDPDSCNSVMQMAGRLGRDEGGDDGFRTVFNTGTESGQAVFHCHAHVISGRRLGWPPG